MCGQDWIGRVAGGVFQVRGSRSLPVAAVGRWLGRREKQWLARFCGDDGQQSGASAARHVRRNAAPVSDEAWCLPRCRAARSLDAPPELEGDQKLPARVESGNRQQLAVSLSTARARGSYEQGVPSGELCNLCAGKTYAGAGGSNWQSAKA